MANSSVEIKYTKIFINNQFVVSKSGKTFATINPATGKQLAAVAEGDKADVDAAVAAAKQAFKRGSTWRKLNASERGKLLWKLADLFERDLTKLAALESLDNGKTFANACGDVQGAIAGLRYYAGYCDKIHGNTIPADGTSLIFTRKEPIGVVSLILPWNYPLLLVANKWGPALAAGCTTILKPAEQTPLTALYAAALTIEAGFPPGVVNVVPGFGPTAGAALSSHPDIRLVSFTGSLEVGRLISEAAAKSNLKKVSLELGGKSPLVIMDDVDIEEAARIAHAAVFENHGQCCCAATRTFVHEKIYDQFVAKAAELARHRKVGDPFDKSTAQGPQVDDEMYQKSLRYIKVGKEQGAKLEAGGNKLGDVGYFIEPTVFSNVTDKMDIARDEIFGPVQCIFKFKTLDEVIERANDTNYGLAAGILTKNIDTALTFTNAVEAGTVWVNTYLEVGPQMPFGGYKESGIGREQGEDGVETYLEVKTVSIKLPSSH